MKVNKIKNGSDEEPKMAFSQMMKNAGFCNFRTLTNQQKKVNT